MALHPDEVGTSDQVVSELVRIQRPDLAHLPVAFLGGGTDNVIYRIGAEHLARLPRSPEKVAALRKELTWLPASPAGPGPGRPHASARWPAGQGYALE